jgi:hypothetical protein
MRKLYEAYIGKVLTGEILQGMIRDRQFLSKFVNEAVNEEFKAGRDDSVSGNELLVRDVLMAYVIRILNADKAITPLTILDLENKFEFSLPFIRKGSQIVIQTGGKIDRIDSTRGVTRIVDYKTGTVSESVNSVNDLFIDDRKKDSDAWLQTLLYCEAYLATNPGRIVRPSVYKIRKLTGAGLTDKLRLKTGSRTDIPLENYMEVRDEFLSGLKELISIIFSDVEPFVKTTDVRGKCSYCPYRTLCMR